MTPLRLCIYSKEATGMVTGYTSQLQLRSAMWTYPRSGCIARSKLVSGRSISLLQHQCEVNTVDKVDSRLMVDTNHVDRESTVAVADDEHAIESPPCRPQERRRTERHVK